MEPTDLHWYSDAMSALMRELVLCISIVVLILCNILKLNRATFFVSIIGIVLHIALANFEMFKLVMAVSAIVTIVMSGKDQRAEFYVLISSILLGADLLAKSEDFIMVLLSMELISISSYVLTAGFHSDKKRAEAAWKFFIYGSAATAIMIFGMTYLYGATGNISLFNGPSDSRLQAVGEIMILAGFLFKMTAAPFHLWAPDVYEATPSPIIAFLSVVPKIAAFCVLVDIVPLTVDLFASFTIIVGTLAALNQTNAKRMMAYSSVAQSGFFLAMFFNSPEFWAFYFVVFAAMNYAVFLVIDACEKQGRSTDFPEFAGFGYTNTFAATAITLGLVSLAGLPPTAGFTGKLLIFTRIWNYYSDLHSSSALALFVIGLLATVASLFFYLKIPFYAFLRRDAEKQPIKISPFTNLLLLILVGLLLTLFLMPGLLMGW